MLQAKHSSSAPIRFGIFELDLQAGELWKDGRKVRLEGQPLQVLALLVEKPGELITREELKQSLWSTDTFVDFELSINAAVKRLRQALGDSADTPRYVETLPRRGYRFIYPVNAGAVTGTAHEAPWPHRHPAWLATMLVIALAAAWSIRLLRPGGSAPKITSLAVLPLDNLTGDPEQEYLLEGIHDELITQIAQIKDLKVISRTSVMRYREKKKPLPVIAAELGVDGVVEGAVRAGGDRMHMTVQLISAADDRHVWAQSYEGGPRDLPKLPGLIALNIAQKLHIALSPQEELLLSRAKPVDPEVTRAFFKGTYYANKGWVNDAQWKAIGFFREALELDPAYAPAWLGLASCYEKLGGLAARSNFSSQDAVRLAKDAAAKAVQLDPLRREPHQLLGQLKIREWDWTGAEQEFQRARELDPAWEGPAIFLWLSGHPEEATAAARITAQRDPLNYISQLAAGWLLFMARHYDEAIGQYKKTIQLDPDNYQAYFQIAWSYTKKDMHDEAARNCDTSLAKLKAKQPEAVAVPGCGWVYALAGRRKQALDQARALERGAPGTENLEEENLTLSALTYEALGDRDRAIALLREALKHRTPRLPRAAVNVMWPDDIRSDPRFQEIIRSTGFPWATFRPSAPPTAAVAIPSRERK